MIDEILEFAINILLESVPNTVWKFIFSLVGVVMTVIGASIITESTQIGSVLVVVGTVLIIVSLLSVYR
jgi:FtsH-binding integral membrane protein